MSMPRVPLEEAQSETSLLDSGSPDRQRTPDPPSSSKAGGYGSLGLAAGKSRDITVPGLHEKLRDALSAQLYEDEDQLQTSREDTASEKFYCQFSPEKFSPPEACTVNLGVALPFGTQRQHTPTNNFACLFGPPQRAGRVDCAKDFRGELRSSAARDQVVSLGTLGHPHTCSEPCKHRKRKTGCLLGARCPKCHLCHWRSERARAAQETRPAQAPAPAAAAPEAPARTPAPPQPHEVPCPAACERTPPPPPQAQVLRLAEPTRRDQPAYVTVCASFGERPPQPPEAKAAAAGAGPPPVAFRGTADCPSVGSIGHPLACQWPCKYASKPRGCKQGPTCNRCHLCHWTRSKEHAKQILDVSGRARHA